MPKPLPQHYAKKLASTPPAATAPKRKRFYCSDGNIRYGATSVTVPEVQRTLSIGAAFTFYMANILDDMHPEEDPSTEYLQHAFNQTANIITRLCTGTVPDWTGVSDQLMHPEVDNTYRHEQIYNCASSWGL